MDHKNRTECLTRRSFLHRIRIGTGEERNKYCLQGPYRKRPDDERRREGHA